MTRVLRNVNVQSWRHSKQTDRRRETEKAWRRSSRQRGAAVSQRNAAASANYDYSMLCMSLILDGKRSVQRVDCGCELRALNVSTQALKWCSPVAATAALIAQSSVKPPSSYIALYWCTSASERDARSRRVNTRRTSCRRSLGYIRSSYDIGSVGDSVAPSLIVAR